MNFRPLDIASRGLLNGSSVGCCDPKYNSSRNCFSRNPLFLLINPLIIGPVTQRRNTCQTHAGPSLETQELQEDLQILKS